MAGLHMKTSPVLSIILGLFIGMTEVMSFAATPKTPEVYAATDSPQEAGVAPSGSQAPILVPTEAPPQAASPPAVPSRPALASAAKAPVAEQSAPLRQDMNARAGAQFMNAQYDAVPLEQVEPFLKRMRLVEELLEKYGRAYDYRIHTVRDLEMIRARLEADARMYSNKSARVAPAVPAVPLMQNIQQNTGSDTRASESTKPDPASGI
jgi:hypothetical protein